MRSPAKSPMKLRETRDSHEVRNGQERSALGAGGGSVATEVKRDQPSLRELQRELVSLKSSLSVYLGT